MLARPPESGPVAMRVRKLTMSSFRTPGLPGAGSTPVPANARPLYEDRQRHGFSSEPTLRLLPGVGTTSQKGGLGDQQKAPPEALWREADLKVPVQKEHKRRRRFWRRQAAWGVGALNLGGVCGPRSSLGTELFLQRGVKGATISTQTLIVTVTENGDRSTALVPSLV